MAQQQLPNSLRQTSRFITDHDAEGRAVFNKDISETPPATVLPSGHIFRLGYATNQFPADPTRDLATYQSYVTNSPGISLPDGTVLRTVDMGPGGITPLHRTVSLDYGVVIEGAVELVLDSGEVRTLQRGDVAVQRGTMHLWRNASKTEWVRMLFVLQGSKPVEIAGEALKEDLEGAMADVPPSGS